MDGFELKNLAFYTAVGIHDEKCLPHQLYLPKEMDYLPNVTRMMPVGIGR